MKRMRQALAAVAILALIAGLGLAGYDLLPRGEEPVPDFLDHHWERPIPLQGEPPAGFSEQEASLDPESCARCHAEQHADWQESVHSETYSAGLRWQLALMSPDEGRECLTCHTPLGEQVALVAADQGWPGAPEGAPPAHVPPDLHRDGLACAACHVRDHQRYGPPPQEADVDPDEGPHGGFTVSAAFEDSRFCASCHQFPEDGPRLNGKLRENTQKQWEASFHADEGRTCQDCHMPDRQHHWKGIHDPETTASALSTEFAVTDERAAVTVRNTGAGHHFPTYMVPEVVLRLVRTDGEEREELASAVIAWRSSVDLTEEHFDRRLPSGEARTLEAGLERPLAEGEAVELVMEVAPKRLYERTFEDYRERAGEELEPEVRDLLELAIEEARATRYTRTIARHPGEE
ncbi:multiheme c-type cytochrome [Thiohalospira sp.]|uniref:multiheme c-type cytochrome n=1 Tax=Thiohalospira sp. TaxID=3080549 RepID=UPI00397FF4FD